MIATFNFFVNTFFQKIYSIKFCFFYLNFTVRPLSRPAILLSVARLATCSIYDFYAPPRKTRPNLFVSDKEFWLFCCLIELLFHIVLLRGYYILNQTSTFARYIYKRYPCFFQFTPISR